MESALGLSYPTIRTRLTQLKSKLALDLVPASAEMIEVATEEKSSSKSSPSDAAKSAENSVEILGLLEKGAITYEQAIKKLKGKKK